MKYIFKPSTPLHRDLANGAIIANLPLRWIRGIGLFSTIMNNDDRRKGKIEEREEDEETGGVCVVETDRRPAAEE